MSIVYIAGDGPDAGVTAAAAGLATLLGGGATLAKAASFRAPDADANYHCILQPDAAPPPDWPLPLTSSGDVARAAASAANAALPPGLTIVEGVSGAPDVAAHTAADAALAEALGARVVLVAGNAAWWSAAAWGSAAWPSAALAHGERLLGVLINGVPAHGVRQAESAAASYRAAGAPVLGLVPEDRQLAAPTVGDVAAHLGAELINADALRDAESAMAALVEYVMLGGLFLDKGVYVFGRREGKAVVVRGDRPDLQMAALETSTVCLVLTEGRLPVQYITHHAALCQTPMLLTPRPTLETMEALHTIGERVTAHSAHKAQRFAELLAAHCDLAPLTSHAPA